MAWRLAKSLSTLLAEANAAAPDRNKRNDGTIGDAAHAARASSHNPNAYGVVTALDITHDPAHGMDCGVLFEYLRTHPHPELRYIIHNRQVARRTSGWAVKVYTGSNPHTGHIHIAVGTGTDSNPLPPYDSTQSWGVAAEFGEEVDDMTPDEVRKIVREEIDVVWSPDVDEAQKHLVEAGLLSKPRSAGKAASVGLVMLLISRVLRKLGK